MSNGNVVPLGTPGTLATVTVTAGVPTAGTGTVSTLDNIFDATNGPVAVKAGSVAPLAADKALVVAISPNGQNPNNRAAATASTPVVICNEDFAAIQALASNTLSSITLASSATRTSTTAGLDGVQVTRPHTLLEDTVSARATDSAGTLTTCLPAPGSGLRTWLSSVTICNSSASFVTVNLVDGAATVKWSLPVPPTSGCVYNPPIPLRGSANGIWSFQSSAAAATITCSMLGFVSKI